MVIKRRSFTMPSSDRWFKKLGQDHRQQQQQQQQHGDGDHQRRGGGADIPVPIADDDNNNGKDNGDGERGGKASYSSSYSWPSSWTLFKSTTWPSFSSLRRRSKRWLVGPAAPSTPCDSSNNNNKALLLPNFRLRLHLDDIVFHVLYAVEAVVLVAAFCFYFCCCGCHV